MDIRPRKRRPGTAKPVTPPGELASAPIPAAPILTDISLTDDATSLDSPGQKRKIWWILGGLVLLTLVCIAAVAAVYEYQLSPVNVHDSARSRVTIASGSTPTQIADTLAKNKLIRSTKVFDIYLRLTNTRNKLQAGTFVLSPSLSTGEIVDHITSGKVDTFKVTFFPGGTLKDSSTKPLKEKLDAQSVLLRAGFSQAEVDRAFAATYNSPLFTDKPTDASLEGYVYGETYTADSSMTASQVLQMAFSEYYTQIQANDIVAGFKAHGLNLYEGITLASVVQAEMGSHPVDMPQVAQVFLKRLRIGMPLGSDVTAYYGASKLGASHSVAVDTPYNTRIHAGLPPGPISTPSLTALKAVARPAAGDYLFFLSGDDGKTYFATTDAQHEANKVHCQQLCAMQ